MLGSVEGQGMVLSGKDANFDMGDKLLETVMESREKISGMVSDSPLLLMYYRWFQFRNMKRDQQLQRSALLLIYYRWFQFRNTKRDQQLQRLKSHDALS